MQSKVFSSNKTLRVNGRLIDLSQPKVMGILNVTPDSFYDGGRYTSDKPILGQAEKMLRDGAAFIDIGGYSTRPGAADVSQAEELQRILPAIQLISKHFPQVLISVDTFRAETARQAVLAGAGIVNDVSGGTLDAAMFATVASLNVPYCLMHMRGNPATMTKLTDYENVIIETVKYLRQKIVALRSLNVHDIIVDPGFGFAKTREQNFSLLEHLDYFKVLGLPVLAGLSRKSMVWKTIDSDAGNSLNGTTSVNTIAVLNGASILRVHDVKEAVESIRLASAALRKSSL